MKYRIVSDGCCDLTQDVVDQYNIKVIPFYVSFDQKKYFKEIEEIPIRRVYERMVVEEPDVYPKTSLPATQDYIDAFTECYEKGEAVICICFTPVLSGSYNSARNAKEIFLEDYPDANVTVINSEAGTVSQALLTVEAGRMQQAGIPYEECVRIIEAMKKSNRIFFTIGNTDYLVHGGRIGGMAGIASNVLSLKPMIVLEDGEMKSVGIGRSRKKTIKNCIDLAVKFFKESGEDPTQYDFNVGFGYDIEEGRAFHEKVTEEFAKLGWTDHVGLTQIGATTAVHTGPHAIGIGILKRYEYYL